MHLSIHRILTWVTIDWRPIIQTVFSVKEYDLFTKAGMPLGFPSIPIIQNLSKKRWKITFFRRKNRSEYWYTILEKIPIKSWKYTLKYWVHPLIRKKKSILKKIPITSLNYTLKYWIYSLLIGRRKNLGGNPVLSLSFGFLRFNKRE